MTLTEPIENPGRFGLGSESLKIPADKIKSAIQWAARQPDMPMPVANAMLATMWFLNVDEFRAKEEEFILSGKDEETLPEHRAMLANIIADGETVILGIGQNGMAATPGNFTLDDIKATLNSLRTTFGCEHGPKNSPAMNQSIERLFNGEKS
ncbi:MAG: hypothetical protein ACLQSR_15520 [Limisphaerales bacterium]